MTSPCVFWIVGRGGGRASARRPRRWRQIRASRRFSHAPANLTREGVSAGEKVQPLSSRLLTPSAAFAKHLTSIAVSARMKCRQVVPYLNAQRSYKVFFF